MGTTDNPNGIFGEAAFEQLGLPLRGSDGVDTFGYLLLRLYCGDVLFSNHAGRKPAWHATFKIRPHRL
jgi:hypothetical protein